MNYSTDDLRLIRSRIDTAIKMALKDSGFEVGTTKGTYGDKLAVAYFFKRTGAAAERDERKAWDDWCGMYGLKPEHYGQEFVVKGTTYKAFGFAPNRPKFCLQARDLNGKPFFFPSKTIERLAGMKGA